MNLNDLKKWVDGAIESGVPGEMVICTDSAVNETPTELISIEINTGEYYNDPAPKMSGRSIKRGQFIYLGNSSETEWGTDSVESATYQFGTTEITWT